MTITGIPVISDARKKELNAFQRNLGIKFRNLELLQLSFMHRSVSNEIHSKISNERLEFLGDAILGAVTASLLYNGLSESNEGELAKIKSIVVSEETLSGIARELQIDMMMILGRGEELSGGREKKALLADALEALFGALYLDSGFKTAFAFVSRCITPEIVKVRENRGKEDYKSRLQEICQRKFKGYPSYRLAKHSGPEHERFFWIEVSCGGKTFGPGMGKNKKHAEQEAARMALSQL
ncbi:MAG: ribonuclease III [Spirochaetaceae bacterium]|jgi:ribonuclease-3|nr:ribonuclease III [Spirochaetaceae bacterium]